MQRLIGAALLGWMLTGCSLLSRTPTPDLRDHLQADPPWSVEEEPEPPSLPPPCPLGAIDYRERDRISLTAGWTERSLPFHECHVVAPVMNDVVALHLHGKYMGQKYRTHLPSGNLGNGYVILLSLQPGEILPVTISGAGEDGADVTYTIIAVPFGEYQVEAGPTVQGPWRSVENLELLDPIYRTLRLRFPRPIQNPDVSRLLRRFGVEGAVQAEFNWVDSQTLLVQVAEDEPFVSFGELYEESGFPIRSQIGAIYFSLPARLVRVEPGTGGERTLMRFTTMPNHSSAVVGGGFYYQEHQTLTWRVDLITGEVPSRPGPRRCRGEPALCFGPTAPWPGGTFLGYLLRQGHRRI